MANISLKKVKKAAKLLMLLKFYAMWTSLKKIY